MFRKLSAVEYSYIGRDTGKESPFVNQFFVEGKGKISLEKMQKAVAQAAEKNPGICLLLEGKWFTRHWTKSTTLPEVTEFSGAWQGNCSENKAVIDRPFNCYADTLSSITLFTNIDKETQNNDIDFKILFRIHHALCDGAGTMHWIKEIFRALREETLEGSRSDILDIDILKQEDYPAAENLLVESKSPFPQSNNIAAQGCHWIKCRWQAKDTKILAKLIFILRELIQAEHGECKTTFRIPSDLRRYLAKEDKQANHFANLSGMFDLKLERNESINDIQNAIIKSMRSKKDLSVYPKKLLKFLPLLPLSLFKANPEYFKNMHKNGLVHISAMISYVAKVNLNEFSCEGFEAKGIYAIPMPLEDKGVYIGLFADEYGLQAVLSVPNALSDIAKTSLLANKIETRLKELEK